VAWVVGRRGVGGGGGGVGGGGGLWRGAVGGGGGPGDPCPPPPPLRLHRYIEQYVYYPAEVHLSAFIV